MDMPACVRDHPWFQGAEGQCACGTQYSSDFRSVRLDVYASDELKVGYDIEAQNDYAGNLAKM